MRYILILLLSIAFSILNAQNQTINFDYEARIIENTEPFRQIIDEGVNSFQVKYTFPGASITSFVEGSTIFQKFGIKNFSASQNIGLPSVPVHVDFILVPEGSLATIQINNAPSIEFNNFLIYPALPPTSDEYGSSDVKFIIDSNFYSTNAVYPTNPVEIKEIVKFKGLSILMVEVHPIQYNAGQRKIYVHSEINYTVTFSHASQFFNKSHFSMAALNILPNYVLNNIVLRQEISQYLSSTAENISSNYLIVTHPDYLEAADSLAAWKEKLGFSTQIISSNSWNSASIKNAIKNWYLNNNPKPDYFVLLGDNNTVPAEEISNGLNYFSSDLYYSTMDGIADYVPDLAYGRISVSNRSQAIVVVNKIIKYESNPIINNDFYSKGLICTSFQDNGYGYDKRPFAKTSEEIIEKVSNLGINIDRVYSSDSSSNPLFWNNDFYSDGQNLTNNLKKPIFMWDGSNSKIRNYINEGRFFVLHRGLGMTDGWGSPYFTSNDINSLSNNNKLPIVFSINSLSGKFINAECFAEKLLRKNNAAVGVFAQGDISFSGFNDGLSKGIFDAIWPNTGLVSNFTGVGNYGNNVYPQNEIFKMGDISNQALNRMVEIWGGNAAEIKYNYEIENFFGDPAMDFRTSNPIAISAVCVDTITCQSDTSLTISNSNFDGLATLVVDNKMISKAEIKNGNATLYFQKIRGGKCILTISGHNMIPFSKVIINDGSCLSANFNISSPKFCLEDSILVSDNSGGNIASRQWNFGIDATPSSGNGIGPFYIHYLTSGQKTITLTILDNNNSSVRTKDFLIDQDCKYIIPSLSYTEIDKCSGILTDDGGNGNYSGNSYGITTISPTGASSVSLNFSQFSFEANADFLKIYDGPNESSPLIGVFTGNNLPDSGHITSSSGSITLVQQSDSYNNLDGFMLQWQCNYTTNSPMCDFLIDDSLSCDGAIKFHDNSTNGPISWLWNFGDGSFSTQKFPEHIYSANGIYSVSLIVSNAYGSDTLIKTAAINIQKPSQPQAIDNERCKAGEVAISTTYNGNGTVNWFNFHNDSLLIDTGFVFVTPSISQTKNYYAEVHEDQQSLYVGKKNNIGNGGYYNSTDEKYLVFDCFENSVLKSVKVYAMTSGYRTILLQNSGGGLIQSKKIFISSGEHRIKIDFNIPAGMNLRLACSESPNLYQNADSINFPYNLQNLISIKHSNDTSLLTNNYYYFYDWEIKNSDCISSRIAVTAFISDTLAPTANFTFTNNDPIINFSNNGNFGQSYYWDFGDGNFSLLENPSHHYTSNGNFNVKFISSNLCGINYSIQQVSIVSASLQTNTSISSIKIYPIPSSESINIELNSDKHQQLDIQIIDLSGRIIFFDKHEIIKGINSFSIEVSKFAKGIYYLNLSSDDGNIIRKIVAN